MLAESSNGYCVDFNIYAGKPRREDGTLVTEGGLIFNVYASTVLDIFINSELISVFVLYAVPRWKRDLTQPFVDAGRCCFFDNFYTSGKLMQYLK